MVPTHHLPRIGQRDGYRGFFDSRAGRPGEEARFHYLQLSRAVNGGDHSMEKTSRIFIAGHRGLVGSAIRRGLEGQGYTNLLLKTHAELDLMNGPAVARFFAENRP